MVSLRRFQELFKMLNCSTQQQTTTVSGGEMPPTQQPVEITDPIVPRSETQPSTLDSAGFGSQRQHNISSPYQRRHDGDREIISQGHAHNTRFYRSGSNGNNYHDGSAMNKMTTKSNYNGQVGKKLPSYANQKTNDNPQLNKSGNKNLSTVNQDRALKILNRETNDGRAPCLKENNKFSRYLPLPAINSSGDNASETVTVQGARANRSPSRLPQALHLRHQKSDEPASPRNLFPSSPRSMKEHDPKLHVRKLTRQLTYKVINPLYVRGPMDIQQCDLRRSQVHPHVRSKTIVIKGSHRRRSHVDKETRVASIEKFSKEIHSKRLTVNKQLIDAAEKVKDGQPMVDNAFWVQF